MIAQIDSTGHKKQFKYDALGRQISLIDALNTPITSTTITEYDKVGNVINSHASLIFGQTDYFNC